MRELVIVFDSVRYDLFMEADAPNLKSLGKVHRAYSHGSWTRPSMSSILSGYLPSCPEVENPWEPQWIMLKFVGGGRRVFYNSNAWMHKTHPLEGVERYYPVPYSAQSIVEDALEEVEDLSLAVLFFMETHTPYSVREEDTTELLRRIWKYNVGGEDPHLASEMWNRQKKAVEYLDNLIKPLLDLEDTRIVFTSDHGELFGEHHRLGHDPSLPFHIKLFEVPLIVSETS
ncbi:MAG: sulfatase-like hydrolase/transferase [Candidatus Bathyarchaeia archaeon]